MSEAAFLRQQVAKQQMEIDDLVRVVERLRRQRHALALRLTVTGENEPFARRCPDCSGAGGDCGVCWGDGVLLATPIDDYGADHSGRSHACERCAHSGDTE